MGLCPEPPQFVTRAGARPERNRRAAPSGRFEQYERHTAWDRPGGVANRSGAGDLEVIIYSARKWARLVLAGNPTVLLALFAPEEEVAFRDEAGAELTANAGRFASRLAAGRYLGYLQGQKAAMTGQTGAHQPTGTGRRQVRSHQNSDRLCTREPPPWAATGWIDRVSASAEADCEAQAQIPDAVFPDGPSRRTRCGYGYGARHRYSPIAASGRKWPQRTLNE